MGVLWSFSRFSIQHCPTWTPNRRKDTLLIRTPTWKAKDIPTLIVEKQYRRALIQKCCLELLDTK